MESTAPTYATIAIEFDPVRITGRLTLTGQPSGGIWERLVALQLSDNESRRLSEFEIEYPWYTVLNVLRDYGSKQQQTSMGFRFKPTGEAIPRARHFLLETRRAREVRLALPEIGNSQALFDRLRSLGFTKRVLREFQQRDLIHLLSLPHGANFSVPGAGKTTVTLALHLLTRTTETRFFVVGPKASFPAWQGVVEECIEDSATAEVREQFSLLEGDMVDNESILRSGATRFLMSYDLMVRQQSMLASFFTRVPVHLVLDEAHRMKAGLASQRGAFLLSVAPMMLRRDILTGTPMPQGPDDLSSQLKFLWPGQGLENRIVAGESPRDVLGELYVRTTKSELGLPKVRRHYFDVSMRPGQQALYGVVRSEILRKLHQSISKGAERVDFANARRSVMRLLQLSVNPILALRGIADDMHGDHSGIIDTVIEEGTSSKIQTVVDHVRALVDAGKKVVVWTIFTDNILELEGHLADLNPVSIYGAIPTGLASDFGTREGRLWRFHNDPDCKVFIGNPAAAGEGISLHMAAHDAIYLDRSYVSTHYLQSIDRIHRLGLPKDTETNIFVYRTKAPAGLGSVDYSVSRRLLKKIRGLQELLNDTDLHEIALDEEAADDPIEHGVELQDLVDLVEELEGRQSPLLEEEAD